MKTVQDFSATEKVTYFILDYNQRTIKELLETNDFSNDFDDKKLKEFLLKNITLLDLRNISMGIVSSTNDKFVFVKYYNYNSHLLKETSNATNPKDLLHGHLFDIDVYNSIIRTEGDLALKKSKEKAQSMGRTPQYYNMSAEEQWAEDKRLGMLDLDGK